jgi:glycosyltransferase involved in cell wall biosynthesis
MPHNNPRIQFILKERNVYSSPNKSYGLLNSCLFIVNKLRKYGIDAEAVQVKDNNSIDKEVTRFKPTHCFVEALWVVAEKFEELAKLHPNIHWIVRLHSEIPFLASEGIAIEWIEKYNLLAAKGIDIAISTNSNDCYKDLSVIIDNVLYHPNIYYPLIPAPERERHFFTNKFNIGCFGALRPLKNHLEQAFLAMKFAKRHNKHLYFHINKSEHEEKTRESILRNLEELFKYNPDHTLVCHDWVTHEEFLNLVATMDMGMQVSFSESFNIIVADFVYCGVPIVGSEQIEWLHPLYKADSAYSHDILDKMSTAYYGDFFRLQNINKKRLDAYNKIATETWLDWLKKES